MYRKVSAVLAVAAVGGIAALLTTGAAAGSSAKRQRVAIVLGGNASTFQLTPMGSGPVHPDSGTVTACCWTNRDVTRDGQSASLANPKLTFKGGHGTFTWRAHLTFVDINNDYTVATGTWKITHGTGAYAHLKGHGRQAFTQKTQESQDVANEAEGVVTING
jgi:hypothetical protein